MLSTSSSVLALPPMLKWVAGGGLPGGLNKDSEAIRHCHLLLYS